MGPRVQKSGQVLEQTRVWAGVTGHPMGFGSPDLGAQSQEWGRRGGKDTGDWRSLGQGVEGALEAILAVSWGKKATSYHGNHLTTIQSNWSSEEFF